MRVGGLATLLAGLLAAACISVSPSASSPTPGPSLPASGIAVPPVRPTAVASAVPSSGVPGAVTVSVTLDGSTSRYVGSAAPSCAYGALGADTWSVDYVNPLAGADEISSLRLIDTPDTSGPADARIVSIVVTLGAVFGGQTLIVNGDRFSHDFSYAVNDSGTGAAFHALGRTLDSPLGPGGATLELTVACGSVARG